jgi:WD40 repeat protein
VHGAVFSPDGRWIASGSQDGMVTVWDTTTGEEWLKFQAHEPQGHARCVAFSPDGRRLATVSWDTTVKVWDLDPVRARRMNRMDLPWLRLETPAPVNRVVFSPDGTRLAAVGDDREKNAATF